MLFYVGNFQDYLLILTFRSAVNLFTVQSNQVSCTYTYKLIRRSWLKILMQYTSSISTWFTSNLWNYFISCIGGISVVVFFFYFTIVLSLLFELFNTFCFLITNGTFDSKNSENLYITYLHIHVNYVQLLSTRRNFLVENSVYLFTFKIIHPLTKIRRIEFFSTHNIG